MRRLEFSARLLLIYAAGILGAISAKATLTAPFAIASILLTAELATRRTAAVTGRDGIDQIVRIFGAIIVTLILSGFMLNFTDEGLTRQTWSALTVVISLGVLWWRRHQPSSFGWLRFRAPVQTAWITAALAVFVLAAVIAVQGANKDVKSPLQMWVQGKSPGAITVAVSSGHTGGPYKLLMDPQVTKTSAFDPFTITPGHAVELGLPAGGSTRYNISLVDVRTGEKLRTVIVDSPPLT